MPATMDAAGGATDPAEQARVAEALRDALATDAASPPPESPPLPPSPPPLEARASDAQEAPTASPAVPSAPALPGSLETASPAWDHPVLYELLHSGSRLLTMPLAQLAADPQVRCAGLGIACPGPALNASLSRAQVWTSRSCCCCRPPASWRAGRGR